MYSVLVSVMLGFEEEEEEEGEDELGAGNGMSSWGMKAASSLIASMLLGCNLSAARRSL